MAFVRYSSGYVAVWDENISIGSLISTYHEGFWILEKIEFNDFEHPGAWAVGTVFDNNFVESSIPGVTKAPTFHYVKVLKSDGTVPKKLHNKCCASFCSKVTKDIARKMHAQEVAQADQKLNALLKFL